MKPLGYSENATKQGFRAFPVKDSVTETTLKSVDAFLPGGGVA
jgi:hypothetical protein